MTWSQNVIVRRRDRHHRVTSIVFRIGWRNRMPSDTLLAGEQLRPAARSVLLQSERDLERSCSEAMRHMVQVR
jgi:hypothetical protein